MPVYQSIDSLGIIPPAFTQLYCSERSQTESARNWRCLWEVQTPQLWIKLHAAVLFCSSCYIPLFPSSHLTQGWSHLIGQRSCHDHDISLSGTCSEHDSETVHVVTGRRHVHHLHGATRQPEGHWPQGALMEENSRVKPNKPTKNFFFFTSHILKVPV